MFLSSASLGRPAQSVGLMSEIFEAIEKEYSALSVSLGQKVTALSRRHTSEDAAPTIADAEAELSQERCHLSCLPR